MNYDEALKYLYQAFPMYQHIGTAAYKADLNNAFALDEYFGQQHKMFKTIHVAGTNGKGSVSHMLASVLQSAGYKTGLYTSPHMLDFRERIRVNGIPVPEEFVADFASQHLEIFKKVRPSFFEMTVFMAFAYFVTEKVDIAVIEVGLGGRLDTTNIITPEVSVITNISKDHTQILGNSLKEIALEKAGIIKKDVPVVIGETYIETSPVFDEIAYKNKSTIYYADNYYRTEDPSRNPDGTVSYHFIKCPHWKLSDIAIDLKGEYQRKNLATLLMSLSVLEERGTTIGVSSLKDGLLHVIKNTKLQGRWQEISNNPLVVCDIAHNTGGIEIILEQIRKIQFKKLHMVLGFVADKDIYSIVNILPVQANYYLCQPNISRAKKVEELKMIFDEFKLNNQKFLTVADAYKSAFDRVDKNDFIYIGGSTFVVADFLAWKTNNEFDQRKA